jgi:hypothetical protein
MSSLRKKPQTFKDGGAVDAGVDVAAPAGAEDAAQVLRAQIAAMKQAEASARDQQSDAAPAESTGESRRVAWVKGSTLAQQHLGELNDIHRDVLTSGLGLVDCSPQYFQAMEGRLAALSAQRPGAEHVIRDMEARIAADAQRQSEPKPEDEHANGAIISAPVSREVASFSPGPRLGQIKLNNEERDIARRSGISDASYAEQKMKMLLMKERGEIS